MYRMSSFARARNYLSQVRGDPVRGKLIDALGSIVISIVYITTGTFMLQDQATIGDLDNSKKNDFHYYFGIANIVMGILLILFMSWKIFFR